MIARGLDQIVIRQQIDRAQQEKERKQIQKKMKIQMQREVER